MATFEKYTSANGEFRFRLKASNGQKILAGEGYKSKAARDNGIESVKKNSQEESRFDLKQNKAGDWYFNLKATNGQVIGTSESYSSESSAKGGVKSVMTHAAAAVTVDV
jgi:uncharacterized protein YegP (UPF0339 family)